MNQLIRTLIKGAYALGIAAALTFGAMQSPAAAEWPDCDDFANGEIGTCPPYIDETCDQDCFYIFGTFGWCPHPDYNVCCICAV